MFYSLKKKKPISALATEKLDCFPVDKVSSVHPIVISY